MDSGNFYEIIKYGCGHVENGQPCNSFHIRIVNEKCPLCIEQDCYNKTTDSKEVNDVATKFINDVFSKLTPSYIVKELKERIYYWDFILSCFSENDILCITETEIETERNKLLNVDAKILINHMSNHDKFTEMLIERITQRISNVIYRQYLKVF